MTWLLATDWEAHKAAFERISRPGCEARVTSHACGLIRPCYAVSYGLVTVLQDFCRVLSELHDKAPVHKWEASKAAIEKAFGLPVEQMFESIDHSAIASGSIAQVPPHPPSHSIILFANPNLIL